MADLLIKTIRVYQQLSHSYFPTTCRFTPSCSQYTIEALRQYGCCKGLLKGAWRILRCSPLSTGGYDPLR